MGKPARKSRTTSAKPNTDTEEIQPPVDAATEPTAGAPDRDSANVDPDAEPKAPTKAERKAAARDAAQKKQEEANKKHRDAAIGTAREALKSVSKLGDFLDELEGGAASKDDFRALKSDVDALAKAMNKLTLHVRA